MSRLTNCCRRSANVSYKYSKVRPAKASSGSPTPPRPPYTHTHGPRVVAMLASGCKETVIPGRWKPPKGKLSLVALNLNSFFVRSSSRFSNCDGS